ncbi:MAG: hypothetical protein SOZ42_01070 [Candidatus Enterosoma sp.]|nr:hypothetical protein [Candidatus Enterosoma sp.]
MTKKIDSVIINKDTDADWIMQNFPIRWNINRGSGLFNLIDRCKKTGVEFKLSLDPKREYKLEVIKGEEE